MATLGQRSDFFLAKIQLFHILEQVKRKELPWNAKRDYLGYQFKILEAGLGKGFFRAGFRVENLKIRVLGREKSDINSHAVGMAVAQPLYFEIDFARNPIYGSAAWFLSDPDSVEVYYVFIQFKLKKLMITGGSFWNLQLNYAAPSMLTENMKYFYFSAGHANFGSGPVSRLKLKSGPDFGLKI